MATCYICGKNPLTLRCVCADCSNAEAAALLEYRSIGAVEEITANMEMFSAYRHVCGGLPPERVEALVKAREEGRLVELDTPCKPLVWGDDDHNTLLCPDCGEDLMGVFDDERDLIQCPNCGQYISGKKAITRQEAEAALSEGGGEE